MKYVNDYEDALIQFARKSGTCGVICGHIHRPEIRKVGDVIYMNCGDWIENCTALVEDFTGKIELIRFHDMASPQASPHSEPTQLLGAAN